MIAMSPTLTLKGNLKFSLKKALIGGDMSKSTYTGPGELLLAPASIGDITIIKLGGKETWSVGKDAFLACTQGIVQEYKSQGIGKAMFSGEGLFVYKISGMGVLWCTSFGAIIRKDVCPFSLFSYPLFSTCILPLFLLFSFIFYYLHTYANASHSSSPTKNTSSTTATSSPGTANTSSSALPRGVSCPT
jgi:hypothetical protein